MNSAAEVVCLMRVKVLWKAIVKLPLYLPTFYMNWGLPIASLVHGSPQKEKEKEMFLAIGEKWLKDPLRYTYIPHSELPNKHSAMDSGLN